MSSGLKCTCDKAMALAVFERCAGENSNGAQNPLFSVRKNINPFIIKDLGDVHIRNSTLRASC